MARPFKCRRICCRPPAEYFRPRGVPVSLLEEVCLTVDEFEAIRLADFGGGYHEQAAKEMNISRQTFGNIINSAHRKIADALVNAKALRIKGGVVIMTERNFKCYECGDEWSLPYGGARPEKCPKCGGVNIHRSARDRGRGRGGRFCRGKGMCERTEA